MTKLEFKIDDETWNIALFPQEEYDVEIGCDSEAAVDVNLTKSSFLY